MIFAVHYIESNNMNVLLDITIIYYIFCDVWNKVTPVREGDAHDCNVSVSMR